MIYTEQTRITPEEGGNCYAACIASIFECPLNDVPAITPGRGLGDDQAAWDEYHAELNAWCAKRNMSILYFAADGQWKPSGYAILSAKSLRFPPYEHAVVTLNGEVVWDPHPKRAEGIGAPVGWTVFQVLDPSKVISVEYRVTQ